MFSVYAIKSLAHNFIYVGMTENLEERLRRHNNGYNKSTKRFAPFKLIYSENCEIGQDARIREKYLKSTSGKRFLRKILAEDNNVDPAYLACQTFCTNNFNASLMFTVYASKLILQGFLP